MYRFKRDPMKYVFIHGRVSKNLLKPTVMSPVTSRSPGHWASQIKSDAGGPNPNGPAPREVGMKPQ